MILSTSMDKVGEKIGHNYYGDDFTGFSKTKEVADLIPAFKDYYYEKRIAATDDEVEKGIWVKVLRGFNEEIAKPMGRKFHPYAQMIRPWIQRWNKDILRKKAEMKTGAEITTAQEIRQIVKTRADGYAMFAPDDDSLEAGVRTLGGEVLNDAMQMLRNDQEREETYDDETLIKRRNYIVNVLSHTTKLVHGKAALMLKASEEKRSTATFMMTLLGKATSGKLSDEEVDLLETAYVPHHNDTQPIQQTVA